MTTMEFDQDTLPELPRMRSSSPKALRRRGYLQNPALVSSTVITSSPQASEVISTLIDSLTAISESARQQLKEEFALPERSQSPDFDHYRPPSPHSFVPDQGQNYSIYAQPIQEEADSDGEVAAAAPVIRFSRSPPPRRKKKSRKKIRNFYSNAMPLSQTSFTPTKSHYVSESRDEPLRMGTPSIERRGDSNTSIPFSSHSGLSRSPQKNSTREPSIDQSATRSVRSARQSFEAWLNGSTVTDRNHDAVQDVPKSEPKTQPQAQAQAQAQQQPESEPISEPLQISSHTQESIEPVDHKPKTPPTGPTINALSPVKGGDLRTNLIPFRRSSMRQSNRHSVDETQRRSTGSRDLQDLNIDTALIDSDDSTVRRIKELQQAREKRQNEWRREAKSPENAIKRHSAPSPRMFEKANSYQNTNPPMVEVQEEPQASPEPVRVSACMTASDLADMPALVSTPPLESPASSMRSPSEPPTSPRIPVVVEMRPILSPRNSGRSSSQLKRSSTTYSSKFENTANESRSISEEVEAFVTAPRLTRKIKHPRTGRMIAFSEVGDPEGFAVVCCVGMGLTRYVTAFYDELATTLKLRLITPDRPGVGESEAVPERLGNPLTWVDDIAVICDSLKITRFSLLAHSAGAIYALATALKMPQFVRGRIHLLAPWIPPSQMPKGAVMGSDIQPIINMPMSHRILSVLPSPILKVANSRFLSTTAAAADPKPKKNKKFKNFDTLDPALARSFEEITNPTMDNVMNDLRNGERNVASANGVNGSVNPSFSQGSLSRFDTNGIQNLEPRSAPTTAISRSPMSPNMSNTRINAETRIALYNGALTHRIWALTKLNANPANDLMICLERRRTIGFRYAEVTRSIVIRHGAKDPRVPLDNVRWLQSIMKRCELRILPEEDHGLLSSAAVMSSVLSEISKEWDEWHKIAQDKEKKRKDSGSTKSFISVSTKSRGSEPRSMGIALFPSEDRY